MKGNKTCKLEKFLQEYLQKENGRRILPHGKQAGPAGVEEAAYARKNSAELWHDHGAGGGDDYRIGLDQGYHRDFHCSVGGLRPNGPGQDYVNKKYGVY